MAKENYWTLRFTCGICGLRHRTVNHTVYIKLDRLPSSMWESLEKKP